MDAWMDRWIDGWHAQSTRQASRKDGEPTDHLHPHALDNTRLLLTHLELELRLLVNALELDACLLRHQRAQVLEQLLQELLHGEEVERFASEELTALVLVTRVVHRAVEQAADAGHPRAVHSARDQKTASAPRGPASAPIDK